MAVQAQKEDFIVNGVSVVGYDAGLHGEVSVSLEEVLISCMDLCTGVPIYKWS